MLILTSIAQFLQPLFLGKVPKVSPLIEIQITWFSPIHPPCLFTVSRKFVCHLTAIRSSTDGEILYNIDALSGSMSLIFLSTVTAMLRIWHKIGEKSISGGRNFCHNGLVWKATWSSQRSVHEDMVFITNTYLLESVNKDMRYLFVEVASQCVLISLRSRTDLGVGPGGPPFVVY